MPSGNKAFGHHVQVAGSYGQVRSTHNRNWAKSLISRKNIISDGWKAYRHTRLDFRTIRLLKMAVTAVRDRHCSPLSFEPKVKKDLCLGVKTVESERLAQCLSVCRTWTLPI